MTLHLPLGYEIVEESKSTGHAWVRGRLIDTHESRFGRENKWERLCTAPCTLELPPADYRLALSVGSGFPITVDGLIKINRDLVLQGAWVSNEHIRRAGLITTIASVIVSGALIAAPVATSIHSGYTTAGQASIISGSIVLLAGMITGVLLRKTPDEARITTHLATSH